MVEDILGTDDLVAIYIRKAQQRCMNLARCEGALWVLYDCCPWNLERRLATISTGIGIRK
jgi:hypothetical protein